MCFRPELVADATTLADKIEELKLNASSENARSSALEGVLSIVKSGGKPVEPLLLPLLPSVLAALADKVCMLESEMG